MGAWLKASLQCLIFIPCLLVYKKLDRTKGTMHRFFVSTNDIGFTSQIFLIFCEFLTSLALKSGRSELKSVTFILMFGGAFAIAMLEQERNTATNKELSPSLILDPTNPVRIPQTPPVYYCHDCPNSCDCCGVGWA